MAIFASKSLYPPLKAIAIEINSACNRRCVYCPNYTYTRKAAFLKEVLFHKIIHELKDINFKGSLTFNLYNEPLLDKRLPEFINYVRKELPSVYIYLNTNGDLLTLSLWKKLRKAGLNFANITQYDGRISNNIQNILNELSLREKIHFYAHIFDTRHIGNRAGLVKLSSSVKLPLKRYCPRPFYQLCVNYKGKVVLCCNDYLGLVEIGDVNKTKLIDIWKNEIFVYYRRKLLKKDRAALKLCNACNSMCIRINTYLRKNSHFFQTGSGFRLAMRFGPRRVYMIISLPKETRTRELKAISNPA